MRPFSKLGKLMRKYRTDHSLGSGVLAEKLGVTTTYVSSVEHGCCDLPESWIPKMKKIFNLTKEQVQELREAAVDQIRSVRINVSNASTDTRVLAHTVAEHIHRLTPEMRKKIIKLIQDSVNEKA